MDLLAQMETYAEALDTAGIRNALDARDVNPPAVLIRPPSVSYRFGRGCVNASWAAWIFLPDAGQIDALRVGFPLLDDTVNALGAVGVGILTATPADFQTADGATVPGFILTWNT